MRRRGSSGSSGSHSDHPHKSSSRCYETRTGRNRDCVRSFQDSVSTVQSSGSLKIANCSYVCRPLPSNMIQNVCGISYTRAWLDYGFHEDRFASGLRAVMDTISSGHPPLKTDKGTPGRQSFALLQRLDPAADSSQYTTTRTRNWRRHRQPGCLVDQRSPGLSTVNGYIDYYTPKKIHSIVVRYSLFSMLFYASAFRAFRLVICLIISMAAFWHGAFSAFPPIKREKHGKQRAVFLMCRPIKDTQRNVWNTTRSK